MVLFKVAWKNLFRNKRRTTSMMFSIAFGVSMMIFANGFNDGMSAQWANFLINQTEGHLKVQHKEFYKYGLTDVEKIVIKDPKNLTAKIKENPHVVAVMPTVAVVGLIGKDDNSTMFYGRLDDLSQKNEVLPDHGKNVLAGQPLSESDPNGVVIGKELARSINAKVGDELVILSNTIHGEQGSALVHVRGLLTFKDDPNAEQSVVLGGLSSTARQDWLDIGDSASELIVRLDDNKNVKDVVSWINNRLAQTDPSFIAVPWYSDEGFVIIMTVFNSIAIVVMIILSIIVSFVISNAMMMSIFERIKEVGTMRAVGLEKGHIYKLFYFETLLISVIGGLLGIIVGCLLILLGNYTGVSISSGMFEGVRPIMKPNNILVSFLVPIIFSFIMAFFTVRSSCSLTVVESLNYS